MYSSDPAVAAQVSIPSVYVTMEDGEMLLDAGQVDLEVSLASFLVLTTAVSLVGLSFRGMYDTFSSQSSITRLTANILVRLTISSLILYVLSSQPRSAALPYQPSI